MFITCSTFLFNPLVTEFTSSRRSHSNPTLILPKMPRNILIVGLGDGCVNLVVEGELPVWDVKSRISSQEVSKQINYYI